MRLSTNDKLIERQARMARYATFGGLGVLLGSLVLSFTNSVANNILLAYLALAVGFFLAMIGSALANKWIKEPRADKALEKALKGFDNKHHLYNYLLPVDHILLTPTGLIVFKVKNHDGNISYRNGKWHRAWSWTRLFGGMGQEGLGNPTKELEHEIAVMRQFLADKIENPALVPIDGYVVFTDPRAQLSLDAPTLPVVKTDDLKDTLRKNKRGAMLSPKLLEQLEQVLNIEANAKTAK